jgi:hypothetical protein
VSAKINQDTLRIDWLAGCSAGQWEQINNERLARPRGALREIVDAQMGKNNGLTELAKELFDLLPEKLPGFGETVWSNERWAKRCRSIVGAYGDSVFQTVFKEAWNAKYGQPKAGLPPKNP